MTLFQSEGKLIFHTFSQPKREMSFAFLSVSAYDFDQLMSLFHSVFNRRIDDFIHILEELFQLLQVTPRTFVIIHLHTLEERRKNKPKAP